MKSKFVLAFLAGLTWAAALHAQVPQTLSYQGQLAVNGNSFNGSGQFKFALVSSNASVTFWSNDGTSAAGSEPTAFVSLDVDHGLYSVMLGDTSLPNMTAIPYTVFGNPGVQLRIWLDDGQNGFQLLSPDQPITAVGYAMMSASVADGAITASKLADGAVGAEQIAAGAIGPTQLAAGAVNSSNIIDASITGADIANSSITTVKLADNSVNSAKLADSIDLGSNGANGRLDVFHTTAGTPSITLDGANNSVSVFGEDGSELGRLWSSSYGELFLKDSVGHETAARLTANNNGGGRLSLYNSNGVARAVVSGENAGGVVTLYQADGSGTGASLDGNNNLGAGQLTLYQGDGNTGAALYGDDGNGSGALSLRNKSGSPRFRLYGGPDAGSMILYNNAGNVNLWGYSYDGEEGVLSVRNKAGNETIYLWGRNHQDTSAGQIGLKKSDGTETITLNADYNGEGRITTQVLQITGGSDLSEQFDINSSSQTLEPGMVVSIDPEHPGQLRLSTQAYDRNVAGVVSGAGGVKPGMLMGQVGTPANGKHPVALTGRVFCQVDARYGAVRPGDLLTASDTPGSAMKVTDSAKAPGSIIGKAMTALESGKGLVLVLVSLQ